MNNNIWPPEWSQSKSNKQIYTLSTVFTIREVLMVRRSKPDWQAGKLNLPGGHVEDDENPIDAADRELREEIGLKSKSIELCGKIIGDSFEVHVFNHEAKGMGEYNSHTDTGDVVEEIDVFDLRHHKVIPNLKIIIPLVYMNVRFTLRGEKDSKEWKIIV